MEKSVNLVRFDTEEWKTIYSDTWLKWLWFNFQTIRQLEVERFWEITSYDWNEILEIIDMWNWWWSISKYIKQYDLK